MKFSPLTSRLAAVASLSVGLAAIWAFWVSPIAESLATDRQTISAAQTKLHHAESLIQAIPELQRQLARLKEAHADKRMFLDGSNPTLLAAEFQRSVQDIARRARSDIGASRTMPVHQEGQFMRLGLQLELTASAADLQTLLYEIETVSPLIIVEHLTVRVPETGIQIAQASDGQPGLSVSLELAAYARNAAAAESK